VVAEEQANWGDAHGTWGSSSTAATASTLVINSASLTRIDISASVTLSPGSVLAVNGTFAQMSSGKLNAQIDGTASNGVVPPSAMLNIAPTVVRAPGQHRLPAPVQVPMRSRPGC
jgi:hypothetical protein